MSEIETEFYQKMEALLIKGESLFIRMKKVHSDTVRIVSIVAGIILLICSIIIVQGYSTTSKSTEALITVNDVVDKMKETKDTQTITIITESKDRELSDIDLKKQIDELDKKLDENIKWLINNMNIKSRGPNPLLQK